MNDKEKEFLIPASLITDLSRKRFPDVQEFQPWSAFASQYAENNNKVYKINIATTKTNMLIGVSKISLSLCCLPAHPTNPTFYDCLIQKTAVVGYSHG